MWLKINDELKELLLKNGFKGHKYKGNYRAITHVMAYQPYDLLMQAAISGKIEVVKYLVEIYRLDPSYRDNRLLRRAARFDQLEIVKYLVLRGCNYTSRHCEAITIGGENVVLFLMQKGYCRHYEYNILRRAINFDWFSVISYVFNHGYNPEIVNMHLFGVREDDALYIKNSFYHVGIYANRSSMYILSMLPKKERLIYMINKYYAKIYYKHLSKSIKIGILSNKILFKNSFEKRILNPKSMAMQLTFV
jgi:hypothetical protein